MAKRRKAAPDLNQEIANALGAATETRLPKAGEHLLARDEAKREVAGAKRKVRKG